MPYSLRSSIEPLEARIAPAVLVVGANLLGGSNNPSTGESSAGGNSLTIIHVTSGEAIAWYDGTHITEISFGPNTSLVLTGDVTGDLVGNLTAAGRLSDSDHNPANGEDGNVLLANNLLSLVTHPISSEKGSVGNIITGGVVAHVNVAGKLHGIYAGDGSFATGSAVFQGNSVTSSAGLTVNPVDPSSSTGFNFQQSAAQLTAGASIAGVTVAIADGMQLFAGSGSPHGALAAGTGLAGGSVSGVHIVSAIVESGASGSTPSYDLRAGAGGSGAAGGAGGSVFNVLEDTASNLVHIAGGKGGIGSAGAGGAGGGVSNLDLQGSSAGYTVAAGTGGGGKPGGAGGSLVHLNFAGQKPNSGIVVAGDFTSDGRDDVLVVDSTTGDMVLSAAQPDGKTFVQVPQYFDQSNNPIFKIAGVGSTPVGAAAVDVNGDGMLDIVVAYKNTNSVGVYYGDGQGGFYKGNGKFNAVTVALPYSPDKMVVGDFAGSTAPDLLITEVTNGVTTVHLLTGDGLSTFTPVDGSATIGAKVVALTTVHAAGGDEAVAGLSSGELFTLTRSGSATSPFTVTDTALNLAGGVAALDANSTGDTVVAVGTTGHLVNTYSVTGQASLSLNGSLDLHNEKGATLTAHFVVNGQAGQADELALLSVAGSGADFGIYTPTTSGSSGTGTSGGSGTSGASGSGSPGYTFASQVVSTTGLNTLTVAYDFNLSTHTETGFGLVALGGSPTQFVYSAEAGTPAAFALPFSGKTVALSSGDGGAGVGAAKGGSAGAISGINVQASDITVLGGSGGSSDSGLSGSGGSIINQGNFTAYGGEAIAPILSAENQLQIRAGDAPVVGTAFSGGAGGMISGLMLSLNSGDISVLAGHGGDGHGGAAGSGGAVLHVTASANDGNLSLVSGSGGKAYSGAVSGGAAGAIAGIGYKLRAAPANEIDYHVAIVSGTGGDSAQGLAGAGGSVAGVTLDLGAAHRSLDDSTVQPPTEDAHLDSTVRVSIVAGPGGTGATGGAGGNLSGVTSTSLFNQIDKGVVYLSYIVMSLTAGDGGTGTAGNGGAGGTVSFTGAAPMQGVTGYDPDSVEYSNGVVPLVVKAGSGHDGTLKGGAGGSIIGLVTQNAKVSDGSYLRATELGGAFLQAGHGGNGGSSDGGAGGSVLASNVSVSVFDSGSRFQTTFLSVLAGPGGNGGAKGGAGGTIASSAFSNVDSDLRLTAGLGGNGVTAGGAGGSLSALSLHSPEIGVGADVRLVAGDGGTASASGAFGGIGGNVSGIVQNKDLNSVINLLHAGSGGAAGAGTGGRGGNVTGVNVVGFIGEPTDGGSSYGAFGPDGLPQGIFAGAAGSGQTVGSAGSVAGIIARQIAAIGAAFDTTNHVFAVAASVSNVHADVIGYDANHDGIFNSSSAAGTSPSQAKPVDGFILAKAISGIVALNTPFEFNS